MEVGILLDFASDAGVVLLESGAETSRVEDTLERMIRHFYKGHVEVFVVLTGMFITIGTNTKTVRVRERTINLDKVSKVNMLSRNIAGGNLDFNEAVEELKNIELQKPYPLWIKTIAFAISGGFFTLLYGGSWYDGLNSFIVGVMLNVFIWYLVERHVANFIVTFCASVLIALATVALYTIGIGENVNVMIIGSIIPLVPGLGTTNALRDIIAGDYLSGGARLFDAVVEATALAAGAGSVMYFLGYMTGGVLL